MDGQPLTQRVGISDAGVTPDRRTQRDSASVASLAVVACRAKWLARFAAVALALAAGCGDGSDKAPASAASFQELRVSDAAFFPRDLSADGGTVVGSVEGGDVDFLWQRETGFVDAATLVGDASAQLRGVSRDGRVVVGISGDRAFRWTRTGGVVWLPTIDGQPSAAVDVSADGRVAVGEIGSEPVLWIGNGTPLRLASDDDEVTYQARAVSADGRAVAGVIFGETRRPFRWQASTGIVDLGDVPGGNVWSIQRAISGDGRTVCGQVVLDRHVGWGLASADPPRCFVYGTPFCWTETTGIVVLPEGPFEPELPADDCTGIGVFHLPVGVSHDGTIVVGSLGDRERGEVALRWDAGGPRAIGDLLAEQGIDLGGWRLTHIFGVSADGQTIIGAGVSPSGAGSGWIAVVPRSP